MMLVGGYDYILVTISLLVAILASYTALDMAGRIATAQGRAAWWWLGGGAFAMGFGIWSMHFVGMLAFSLPIPLGYDLKLTLLSLLIAIGVSAFALRQVAASQLSRQRLTAGAVLMGIGIAAMHYTGMAAMRMQPPIQYDPWLFALSIVIAIGASGAALWIFFQLRKDRAYLVLYRAGAAVLMGVAIVGMHYTGMAAANFPADSVCGAARGALDAHWLALLVVVMTLAVLAIALITSVLDARMETRTSLLAKSLAKANRELSELALQDNLTKLPNRVLLEDRLSHALSLARRESTVFALMFMDLDGFKAVNDAYGHDCGDRLLIEVAQRIRGILRVQDTVARLGGDEFVLLLEQTDPEGAASVADKLVHAVGQPYRIGQHALRVSASVGIAMYPSDGDNAKTLMANADAAMYYAKNSGRNGYYFFEASMNANAHDQLQLMHDLQVALERKEFVLHYQTKYVAPAGPIIGAEALLRWQHPTRGLIAPDKFIPHAEKTGLIIAIGEWVLDEACRQMHEWHEQGCHGWKVAVNLSPIQFAHPSLVNVVRNTLERHKLPPNCLTLEVTETTAMRNADVSLAILERLAEMGVDISIDDFGTGYSSLLYLKRLPASELKIDKGFVQSLAQGNDDAAIVSSIIALGRTLNLRIVAEGVETQVQQAFLTELGCDALQGYLLSKPVPASEIKVEAGSIHRAA